MPKDVGHSFIYNFDFCACTSKNVIERCARGKKGMLSYCKCLLEWIGANLAHFQAENLQKRFQVRVNWSIAPFDFYLVDFNYIFWIISLMFLIMYRC